MRPQTSLWLKRAALAALCSAPLWALAAPAGWYWWHSRLDSDLRVCAQFMPSQGWERRGGPFDNPRCAPGPAFRPQR